MPKETKFHGILSVGRTKADAINNYRLLAMSKGAAVQVDEGREIAFVTRANSAEGMFNPMSGNMDLETDDQLLSKLEFKSNSSAEDVEVHHLVCTSGCMSHVIFDSAELVKFCPNCTSSLSEDDGSEEDFEEDSEEDADLDAELGDDDSEESESADDEEEGADESEEDEEGSDESEEDEEGSDDEEGADESEEDEEGSDESEEDEEGADDSEESEEDDKPKGDAKAAPAEESLPEYSEDEGSIVIAADSLAQATKLLRDNLPKSSLSSLSSQETKIDAHYMMCSSDDCGAHVLSTDEITECPACHSSAVEPQEEAISEDGGSIVIAADSLAQATKLLRDNLTKSSLSSQETKIDAHYMMCSSDACGAHVLSTDEIAECPACHSPAVEPQEEAISEDDSEDEDLSDDSEGDDSEGDDSEGDESTLSLTDDEGSNVLDENTEELDSMDEVDETAEASALDVSYSSSVAGQARWTAFYAGVPVAMASKSSAGKNADIFDTPSFGHAALATAKVGGVKNALAELGFVGLKRKVSVSKAVSKMVAKQVDDAHTAMAADKAQFKERYMAALASAAVGLNRGFFADKKNPVKSTLWNSMSSAGIRNPEVLIDTAFKNHSDAYHKTLFEIADDIASKPADVQNSLSKAIAGMSYQEVSTSSADASLEDRLETLGASVSSATAVNPQPTVAVQRQQITNAVKSLGRRSR